MIVLLCIYIIFEKKGVIFRKILEMSFVHFVLGFVFHSSRYNSKILNSLTFLFLLTLLRYSILHYIIYRILIYIKFESSSSDWYFFYCNGVIEFIFLVWSTFLWMAMFCIIQSSAIFLKWFHLISIFPPVIHT